MILEAKEISKTFPSLEKESSSQINILSDVSFYLKSSSSTALMGASGSGKTTLLSLCAGLDLPTKGSIYFNQENLTEKSEFQRTILRRNKMGFIFQDFQLIPNMTALENVMVPLELISAIPHKEIVRLASDQLKEVELAHRLNHFPNQLSGGEQQRVAIARAIVHHPEILFADEPTGNLDSQTGEKISDLLFSLQEKLKMTLLIVTHSSDLAAKAQKIIKLKGGRIV